MNRKPVIGVLDLGASGGRVLAFVLEGDRLRPMEVHRFSHGRQRYHQMDASTGTIALRRCWDLPRIFQGVKQGLQALAAHDEIELASFGIDTWGSDGTWIDEDGDMLCMVGTGRDDRWTDAREKILSTVDARRLFEITGVQSHPFNVLNQVYWYARHRPKLVAAAATYMPISSLLYYFLTGDRMAEYTRMSTTQLCTLGRNEYTAKKSFPGSICHWKRCLPWPGPGPRWRLATRVLQQSCAWGCSRLLCPPPMIRPARMRAPPSPRPQRHDYQRRHVVSRRNESCRAGSLR